MQQQMGSEHLAAKIHLLYVCDSEWQMSEDLCRGDGIGWEGPLRIRAARAGPLDATRLFF